ncbi:MAG: hydrogenase maturation protease [Solirubrobacteraceae bacterium]
MSEKPSVVVIGVGNALRYDDAAGLHIARGLRMRVKDARIAVREHEGEALALLEIWEGAEATVLADAISSGAPAGTIHRLDASRTPLPTSLRSSSSTHAVSLGDAIELARAMGRLPARVVVFGIEGSRFDAGSGLSREVVAVLGRLSEAVLAEAQALAG